MDRARDTRAPRTGSGSDGGGWRGPGDWRRWGLTLRHLVVVAFATLCACKLNTDPDQAVAIEVILPDSGRVEVTDTFRPRARALNALGDSVAAEVLWRSLDSALTVLDSTTGVSLADSVGTARLQARTGTLFSNLQTVTILAKLDTVYASAPPRDTLFAPDSLSDSLALTAEATGGPPVNRRVVYAAATYPASGSTVTFVPNDTIFTSSAGVAAVRLRFVSGIPPDSVVVSATMRRLNGTHIPGSPVTFVVEFRP